jgi:hypothetical protein
LAINGRDAHQRQPALGRDRGQRLRPGALVLDRVVHGLQLGARPLERGLAANLGRNLLEGPQGACLDFGDAQEDGAETALDGRGHGPFRQGERGFRRGRIEHVGACEGAEFERRCVHAPLGRDRLEGRPVADAGLRRLGVRPVRERDLLHGAALGRAVARSLRSLVEAPGILLGDAVRFGGRGRVERQESQGAVFRRAESRAAVREEAVQFGLGRRGDLAQRRGGQEEVGGGPALRSVAVDRLAHGERNRDAARKRLGELLTRQGAPLLADELRFAESVGAHEIGEQRAVEGSVSAAEAGVALDRLRDDRVRDAEAHLARLLVERRLRDQARQHARLETKGAGLLGRDGTPGSADELLVLVLVGRPVGVGRDVRLADGRDFGPRAAAEDVADAPDRERDDEKAEQDEDHHPADPALADSVDALKHVHSLAPCRPAPLSATHDGPQRRGPAGRARVAARGALC